MNTSVEMFLKARGYQINTTAYDKISACDSWYRTKETEQHRRTTVSGTWYTVERMGFGKRVAADDANLCEVVEINAGGGNESQFHFVNQILQKNQFETQYRRQLELTAAEGTVACYVSLQNGELYTDNSIQGGEIRLNYVGALGFVPLTVENDEVLEAAFISEDFHNTEKETTVVLCTRNEAGSYQYETRVFDLYGVELKEKRNSIALGNIKPFAVMRTAEVNNLPDMEGFGYPKLWSVIPVLYALDCAFTVLLGDIETAEKITLINEMLCKFDSNGEPITPNDQMKRRFVLLGEKLPAQDDLVHEITPEIRIVALKDTIELLLSLLSMQFGYGTKKYQFNGAQITTATQYIGERQDQMQELNKQRKQAEQYITGIIRAILWFENTFHGANWEIEVAPEIEFDDSYITDKQTLLAEMRNDIAAGIGGVNVIKLYLMEKYNLEEKEALQWAMDRAADADEDMEPLD